MSLNPSSGWKHRKKLQITDTANASADYQLRLKVFAGSGDDNVAEGIVYCDNKCENFPYDIRFGTTSDPGTATQLAQWIESYDSTQAIIWVKCPTDGSDTLYMFAGNSTAAFYSDGDHAFLFFDDFEGTSLDITKWNTVSGSTEVSNGKLQLVGSYTRGEIESKTTISIGAAVRIYAKGNQERQDLQHFCSMKKSGDWNYRAGDVYGEYGQASTVNYNVRDAGSGSSEKITISFSDAWHYYEITWREGEGKFFYDDALKATLTSNVPTVDQVVVFQEGNISAGTIEVDWVLVRKYVDPEPAWSEFGPWESITPPVVHKLIAQPSRFFMKHLRRRV